MPQQIGWSTEAKLLWQILQKLIRLTGVIFNIKPGGASAINDLTDVTITSAAAGDTLEYDGTAFVNVNKSFTELTGTTWDGTNKYKTSLSGNLALTLNSTKVAGLLIIEDNNSHTLTINGTSVPINATAATVIGFTKANGVYYIIDKDGLTIAVAGPDVTAPTVVSVTAIDANTIRKVFGEAMGTVTIAGHSFKQNGVTITPDSVSGSGTTWNFVVSETLLSTDTLLDSYNSSTGATSDAAGNELGSYTDAAVTNSIAAAPEDLNFTTVTSGFAKTSNYWQGNLGPAGQYNNYGLANKKLAAGANGYIEFRYQDVAGADAILAFRLTNVNEKYSSGNYKAGGYINGTTVYRIDNNSIATAGSIAIGEYLRITRTAGGFKLQKRNGVTVTDLYDFTFTSNGDVFVQGNIDDDSRLYDAVGFNLTAI